ncbi:MAG: hypothetical protein LBS74_11035, partial [Oscillospiraceae bacterium]|nr:hypothetical protein [Oscillospiraceae bacterium]
MKKKLATQGRRSLAFTIMLLMLLSTIALSPATASITVSAAGPTSGQNMDEYRVIAYVTQWSWPGTDDPMVDNDATTTVDPMRVTHINYAFGHIVQSQGTGTSYTNGNQNSAQFPGTVDVPDPDKLRALVALKAQNPKLKVLLSIGGWGMDGFCPIVHDATKRAAFVNSCLEICKTYGLDGIDMDYEYPGTSADSYDRLSCSHDVNGSGVTESGQDSPPGAADGNDYVELMKAFRNNAEYGYNYLLTIASGIGYDWAVASATPQYPNYLDFINIMTYDIYGEWRNHSEFNANLYGSGSLSSDTEEGGGKVLSYDLTCNRIALRGYPRDIMNIGIPLYGRERYYRRSTAAPARNLNNVTPLPASLGDNSWMTFNQIMSLYDANASTESKVLKDVIGFTDIATDPNLNKTTVQIGKGGVVTTVGGYTRAQVAETEL